MNATPAENLDAANIVGHFINGKDVADDSRPLPGTNPATGQITKHVAMATKATVEDASSSRPVRVVWSVPIRSGHIMWCGC